MLRLPVAVLLTLATASPISAQTAAPPATPSAAPTEVSGVTVTARRRVPTVSEVSVVANWCPKANPERYPATVPPRVVSTYPADGAVVAPGVLNLSITFDQPMTCSWSIDYTMKGLVPCEPDGTWLLPDRRTWNVRCTVRPRASYGIKFGEDQSSDDGPPIRFTALSGQPAETRTISFSTSDERPVRSDQERAARDPSAPILAVAGAVVCPPEDEDHHSAPCRHLRPANDEAVPAER